MFIISRNWYITVKVPIKYFNGLFLSFVWIEKNLTKLTFTNYSFARKMNLKP